MIWLIIFSFAVLIFASSRLKNRKLELNDEDLLLFYKYRDMMKGKLIAKRPENLSEWEKHIWLLASEERNIESQKSFYKGTVIFLVVVIVIALLFIAYS